jgi:serine/threonine protein kinase
VKFDGPLLQERWRLGPRMGSGAQARTYLARDERDGEKVVVVKQLRLREGADRWKKFDLFEREARVLKSLRHTGIPRFLDYFESEPGVFNLVMERAPGASLRAIATRFRFTAGDLRDVMVRVLDILHYLHGLSPPVIHRDIKPANLVRDADGGVTLVDFGGVREIVAESGGSTVVGTFGYMAPEQLHGQAIAATDIYGLGATIVALAGGVEPESVPRKGLKMDLGRHLAHLDPALVEVLEAMTQPDPGDRPGSAMAVMDLLRSRPIRHLARAPARELELATRDATAARYADDDDELADMPPPLQMLARVLFAVIGTAGWVGLTVVRGALLPLMFALAGVFVTGDSQKKLDTTRDRVAGALEEGRQGFKSIQRKGLPGRKRRALLGDGKRR